MTLPGQKPDSTIRLWPIVLLRLFTGAFFLHAGIGKILRGGFENSLERIVTGRLDQSFEFFRPFLESVVLPHKLLFATLVSWGELLIGLAMILGLATRYAATAGALMITCFWMMKGQHLLMGSNQDGVWVVVFLALAGFHAGRVYGLDERLGNRFRFLS